jgi:hypothetical protein
MSDYKASSTDWFTGSLGVSVHWTSLSKPIAGPALNYHDAVDKFDLPGFIGQLKTTGARHLIFTLTHAEQYIAGPHPIIDYLLPGHTCSRDLLGELAESLARENIRLIFYYNHSCNGNDHVAWKNAVGYDGGQLDIFAARIMEIVEYMSRRYSGLISGWWFDSSYTVDPRGPHNFVTVPMGSWRFPWEGLTAAAKSGNPQSIVTYNSGVDCNYLYTTHQDYYAGETTSLQFHPEGRYCGGLQLHQWTCIDNELWVHDKLNTPFSKLLYADEVLSEFTQRITGVGGAVTYNVEIDQRGQMNPAAIEQLKKIYM